MPKERPPPEPGMKGWFGAFLRGSKSDYNAWKASEREREEEYKEHLRRKEQHKRDKEKAKRQSARETGESSKTRDKDDDPEHKKPKHKHKHKRDKGKAPDKSGKGKNRKTNRTGEDMDNEVIRAGMLTDRQYLDGSFMEASQTQSVTRGEGMLMRGASIGLEGFVPPDEEDGGDDRVLSAGRNIDAMDGV